MTDTRTITLGTRTFAVPLLPLRHNRVVYPLCRDLSRKLPNDERDAFDLRILTSGGTPQVVGDDEWPKLIDIAFHAASAADPELKREDFDAMPITPLQLVDAFFAVRMQTGVWIANPATGETSVEDAGAGEAVGVEAPLP